MLLFTAHDPGAKNHIWPIYEHALNIGEAAEFVDLASAYQYMEEEQASRLVRTLNPELLIAGCSTNQAELALIRSCKRIGINAIVVIDLGLGRKLDNVSVTDFPARFMVTNSGCLEELIAFGAPPACVVVTGSAHLERLSQRRPGKRGSQIKSVYDLDNACNLLPFFCAPDTYDSIDALMSLASLITATPLSLPILVVRPHPRTADKGRLEKACRQYDHVYYDTGDRIKSLDLLRASRFSLAMGSTVSLESLVLGTPSAFYQIGWDFLGLDRMYRNVDIVPKIRDPQQLIEFVTSVMNQDRVFIPNDIENYEGELGRSWNVISDLREQVTK